MTTRVKTRKFQAEARQLLELVIHSVYSNKDVFLRELVSNASDALDKLRIQSFQDKELDVDVSDLHIEIHVDTAQRTLTIVDNGIGMSQEEVISLVGTIAKSGTAEFLDAMSGAPTPSAEADLIGQFGVGLYATFMVADRVTLTTRRVGEEHGTHWESTGDGTYTLQPVDDTPTGTTVTLYLKQPDADDHLYDYADPRRIRDLVKRYSDFVRWPIRMPVEPPESRGMEGDTGGRPEDQDADEEQDIDDNAGNDPAAERGVETINSMKALWARPRAEVEDEEYASFYRTLSYAWDAPLEVIRLEAEGTFQYQALLFIPSYAPVDLFTQGGKSGLQLYVKRVHVMDDCEALMPEYLRFVKGVVDAQDLSLNVSREALQQDRQILLMRRRLVKKVLTTIREMMTRDPDRYRKFWAEFGRAVKEGLLSDFDNQEAILDIASFDSTYDATAPATLRQYTERMDEEQDVIYYATGESRSILERSPHMEAFRARGLEVLLLTDPIDEMWISMIPHFDGIPFQSIAQGNVDLGANNEADEESSGKESDNQEQDFADMLAAMTDALQDRVKDVRLSTRLTASPACLVGEPYDMSPALEKMYRAMGQAVPPVKRTLELNPAHPVVTGLQRVHADDAAGNALPETAELLHGMALLAEGGELSDPARFTQLLADRLARGM